MEYLHHLFVLRLGNVVEVDPILDSAPNITA